MERSNQSEQDPSKDRQKKEKRGEGSDQSSQSRDTSLMGREEEVINQQDQNRTTNSQGEDQFRQGMGDNDQRYSEGHDKVRPGTTHRQSEDFERTGPDMPGI